MALGGRKVDIRGDRQLTLGGKTGDITGMDKFHYDDRQLSRGQK